MQDEKWWGAETAALSTVSDGGVRQAADQMIDLDTERRQFESWAVGDDEMPWRARSLFGTDGDDDDDAADDRPRWRRLGIRGGAAMVAVLLVATAVTLQVIDGRRDTTSDASSATAAPTTSPAPDAPVAPSPSTGGAEATTVPGPPTTSPGAATASSSTAPAPGSSAPAAAPETPAEPAAPGTGTAPAPSTDGGAPVISGDYTSNLKLIQAQSIRNRNEDDSPYLATPSAQLVAENHYGPRAAYLNNPGGNPEQAFPVASGGQFRVGCEFSHFAYDDPLVYPGQPGASHLHMFFGNTHANAFSTSASILNTGGGTCNGQELNRTAYWAPAMFDGDGDVQIPERIVVYYKGEGLANGKAEPFPEGAAMVTTVDLNTVDSGKGGAAGKFSFVCSDNYSGSSDPASNTMPSCDGSRFMNQYGGATDPHVVLEMNVKFPQCWNGKDPSNPANYSHPTQGGWYYSQCAGEFNRTLVNLEYFINYKVQPGDNTADWYLSSDVDAGTRTRRAGPAGATTHADWWSGWHKQTNQMFLDNCVNFRTSAPSGCGFGYLTDGGPDNANPLPGPALKYRDQFTGPSEVTAAELYKELCPGGGNLASATAAAYCRPGSAVVRASLANTSFFCRTHPGMAAMTPREDNVLETT